MSDSNSEYTKHLECTPSEHAALAELSESADPMARVLYHMSMRQLAMVELVRETQHEVMRVGGAVGRVSDKQDKIVKYIDTYGHPKNGSNPTLKAVLGMGE